MLYRKDSHASLELSDFDKFEIVEKWKFPTGRAALDFDFRLS